MSERNVKNNFSLHQTMKNSLVTVLALLITCIILSFVTAFLLKMSSIPELFYPFSGYVIIAVATFITGKLYFKKIKSSRIAALMFSALIFTLITAVLAVAINDGKTRIAPILIKFAIVFTVLLLSSVSSQKKKRKKTNIKRR